MSEDDLQIHRETLAQIDTTLHQVRTAIAEAIGYIERQEDGSLTMRLALKAIRQQVDALEDKVYGLHYTAISLTRIAVRLREQRDEALRQRDARRRVWSDRVSRCLNRTVLRRKSCLQKR
jgi:chromosome segregation ATPase